MQEITSKFTQHLKDALAKSLALAVETRVQTVEPIHLLFALTEQKDSIASKLLEQSGVKKDELEKYMLSMRKHDDIPTPIPNLSEETKIILEKAVITAASHQHRLISTEHLLFGILQTQTQDITNFFQKQSIDVYSLQTHLKQTLSLTIQIPIPFSQEEDELMAQEDTMPEQIKALDYFTKNLTNSKYQKSQMPVIGREKEINRLCTILCRKTKNNPILIGEPGVGKSAIVEGLAQKIINKQIRALENHNIYSLSMASLMAGTMYRGSFEARLQQLIEEIKEKENSILFIDEIHTIVGSGSNQGTLDAANILKPALARGEIRCIGATTHEEYKRWIESDGALERRFQKLQVEEPSKIETREILRGIKKSFTTHHKISYPDDVIDFILDLADTHFPDKRFPDKAIDLLDEVGSYAKQRERNIRKITSDLVIETLCSITGSSANEIKKQTKKSLGEIEKSLCNKVLGQDEAIADACKILKRARVGLGDARKPMASFLFVGPSGVGKTELAKQIAQTMFQGPRKILRLDMSEYKEAFNASKLLGSPAGYIGYRDANVLSDHIRNYPRSVILFDEIEKAHPDIHNLLLQILEEGTLRDATGRELSFANAVIILTSNANHKAFEQGAFGFADNKDIDDIDSRSAMEDFLRPEILNRIDQVCIFKPLSEESFAQIAHQRLDELAQKIKEQGIEFLFDSNSANEIARNASKKHGARGIDQQIAQKIEPLIIDAMLCAKPCKKIKISFDKNKGFGLRKN